MNQLQLSCPNCQAEIKAADINVANTLAKCAACNTVFDFAPILKRPMHKKQEILLPPGIEAYATNYELDIELNWRKSSKALGFFLFFTLFWNGIVSIFVVTALLTGSFGMLAAISIHLLIGIGLLYYVLSVFFNTTYIVVNQRELSIEHRPLKSPFYPNRYIASREIDQIFVEKYVAGKTNGTPNYAFGVQAVLQGGKRVKLVKGLKNSDQALYVEQEIESFLSIQDEPVDEEWKG